MPQCPHCGEEISGYRNPIPTVDIVIEVQCPTGDKKVVLIKRRNFPPGWALPGGFIDYGESAEAAAVREAKEETSLDVEITGMLGVYSKPERDPRFHTITTVFTARAEGEPRARDDAAGIAVCDENSLPDQIAFDHRQILSDYFAAKNQ